MKNRLTLVVAIGLVLSVGVIAGCIAVVWSLAPSDPDTPTAADVPRPPAGLKVVASQHFPADFDELPPNTFLLSSDAETGARHSQWADQLKAAGWSQNGKRFKRTGAFR